MKTQQYIFENILNKLVSEQAEDTAGTNIETDNAPSAAPNSAFTPAEERFLGKFDAYGTQHLGIIYSPSDAGIREFIARSGASLNVTPEIILNLIRNGIIKIVPYTGFGRNDDYTLELQLSLDDVAGLGKADKEKAETGNTASGAASGGGSAPEMPPAPGPEVAWVINYGDLLSESYNIAKSIKKKPLTESKKSDFEIFVANSRVLKRYPREFIQHLTKIVKSIDKTSKTQLDIERVIADIIDNLQVNLKLNAKAIQNSFNHHKKQKKLQKFLDK